MENNMINPTAEMDNAISSECPGPDCDCPSCKHDREAEDAEPEAAWQHRRNALDFLKQAAEALDQAEAELRDIGLAREIPVPSAMVDYREIFPNAYPAQERLRSGNALSVADLVQAVVALHQEIRG